MLEGTSRLAYCTKIKSFKSISSQDGTLAKQNAKPVESNKEEELPVNQKTTKKKAIARKE